jgi:hypothetical protein
VQRWRTRVAVEELRERRKSVAMIGAVSGTASRSSNFTTETSSRTRRTLFHAVSRLDGVWP